MLTVLFAAGEARWPNYEAPLKRALSDESIDASLVTDAPPQDVDYIIYAPGGVIEDFRPYTRTKAVLSLWAGVEKIVTNPTLSQPLCRMVDPSLTKGMVEYVAGHVLRHHLCMDAYIHGLQGAWIQDVPPLASERHVTILGMGELGKACAETLLNLGFSVTGWSRRKNEIPGIVCYSDMDGLSSALAKAEILVTLLPRTPQTENLLDHQRLSQLPKGAVIINPGRGELIDDEALLQALETGQIKHTTLDVFRQEPLPKDHPYWQHPRVTVTPHIAAETRPDSAARVVVENIRRGEADLPFLHVVDRNTGY